MADVHRGHREVELTAAQRAGIGMLVGAVEQAIMRPSVFWKSELQQQRFELSRALNPWYCYRGLPVAVVSIAPITGIQFGATAVYQDAFQRMRGLASPTDGDRLVAGVLAGMTAALVQSPCQLVEVNQQNHGGTMGAMAQRVVREYGVVKGLYRGFSMTAIREGVFCSSYIAVQPFLKRQLMERNSDMSEGTALAASSFVSGGLGALLSHPADTLKTRLQGGLFAFKAGEAPAAARISGPRDALKDLQRNGGMISQCYSGFAPRLFRIICCTYIYSSLTEFLETQLRKRLVQPTITRVKLELPDDCAAVRGLWESATARARCRRHAVADSS